MGTHLRVLNESYPMSIPTCQGLDDFEKSLLPCALDKSSLSIGRVNSKPYTVSELVRELDYSIVGRAVNSPLLLSHHDKIYH